MHFGKHFDRALCAQALGLDSHSLLDIPPQLVSMMRHKLVSGAADSRFISEQGTQMGRRSILHVHIHGKQGADGIDVGGYVTPIIEATMTL